MRHTLVGILELLSGVKSAGNALVAGLNSMCGTHLRHLTVLMFDASDESIFVVERFSEEAVIFYVNIFGGDPVVMDARLFIRTIRGIGFCVLAQFANHLSGGIRIGRHCLSAPY